jgi:hypothetical protein
LVQVKTKKPKNASLVKKFFFGNQIHPEPLLSEDLIDHNQSLANITTEPDSVLKEGRTNKIVHKTFIVKGKKAAKYLERNADERVSKVKIIAESECAEEDLFHFHSQVKTPEKIVLSTP